MKKTTLLLIALLPLLAVVAQKKNKTSEKFGNTITAADLKKHLYIVASADNEGSCFRRFCGQEATFERDVLRLGEIVSDRGRDRC